MAVRDVKGLGRLKMRMPMIFLLIHLAMASLCVAQVMPDGRKEKLRGPVHTIQTESAILFQMHGRSRNPSRTSVASESFDSSGNLTEAVDYKRLSLGTAGTVTARGVYAASDVDVDESAFSGSYAVSRIVSRVDDKGRIEESADYDTTRALNGKISYDDAGRRVEIRREEKGKTVSLIKNRYDGDGRLIQASILDGNGTPITTINCDYLYDVVRIESKTRQENGGTFKVVRLENQRQGKTDLTLYHADNTPAWKWTFTYDDRGNVASEEFSNDLLHDKWAYTYDYDAQGNWTQRTRWRWFRVSGKPQLVAIEAQYRTITYYQQPYERQESGATSEDKLAALLAGGLSQSEWLERTYPDYPIVAQSSGVRGTVVVEITTDEEGNVSHTRVSSGHPMLSHAAEVAAKHWKFKPTLLNGVPVQRMATITFAFTR